jgi:hypothetical protein
MADYISPTFQTGAEVDEPAPIVEEGSEER